MTNEQMYYQNLVKLQTGLRAGFPYMFLTNIQNGLKGEKIYWGVGGFKSFRDKYYTIFLKHFYERLHKKCFVEAIDSLRQNYCETYPYADHTNMNSFYNLHSIFYYILKNIHDDDFVFSFIKYLEHGNRPLLNRTTYSTKFSGYSFHNMDTQQIISPELRQFEFELHPNLDLLGTLAFNGRHKLFSKFVDSLNILNGTSYFYLDYSKVVASGILDFLLSIKAEGPLQSYLIALLNGSVVDQNRYDGYNIISFLRYISSLRYKMHSVSSKHSRLIIEDFLSDF